MYFCIGLRDLCPGGGIGRHATLRGWCRFRRASSTLVLGTQNGEDFSVFSVFLYNGKHNYKFSYDIVNFSILCGFLLCIYPNIFTANIQQEKAYWRMSIGLSLSEYNIMRLICQLKHLLQLKRLNIKLSNLCLIIATVFDFE